MPDTFKLIVVFAVMIVLLIRKKPLTWVLIAGTLMLALLYQTPPPRFFALLVEGALSPVAIELVFILFIIMVLEYLLRTEHYQARMLSGLQAVVPYPRLILCVLPAFIGLMPSAGGAIFSAPLVQEAAKDMRISPEQKSFVNFYYRHISEYMLPIYPNVLLGSSLTGVPIANILQLMMPFGLLMIVLGVPQVLRIPKAPRKSIDQTHRAKHLRDLLVGLAPIVVVVAMVLLFHIKVWMAVGAVLAALLLYHRYTPVRIAHLVRKSFRPGTLLMVIAVMVFSAFLQGTGAVLILPAILGGLPVPSWLIFIVIFFLLGAMTGFVGAVVGIGIPLALGVFGTLDAPMVALFFISGLCGQMMTPLHLCMALTADYFKADLSQVMRMLIVPEMTLQLVVILVFAFLHA